MPEGESEVVRSAIHYSAFKSKLMVIYDHRKPVNNGAISFVFSPSCILRRIDPWILGLDYSSST